MREANSHGFGWLAAEMCTLRVRNVGFNTLGHNLLKLMAIKAGVPPISKHQVEIRELLGHAKLSSTDIYMHLSKDDLKGATDCLVEGMPWLIDNDPKVVPLFQR